MAMSNINMSSSLSSAPEDTQGNMGVQLEFGGRGGSDTRRIQSMSVEADMSIGENTSRLVYTSKRITEDAFSVLDELRQSNQLCDVRMRVAGQDFVAHRVVLAATCPYFRGMFTAELSESRQDVITLKEVDPSAIDLLIKFVYTGTVEVTEENVQSLLPAANLLQLTEVRDACCEFLKKQLHPSNCLGIMSFADLHSCSNLLQESQRFARKHFPEVVKQSEEYLNLRCSEVIELISSNELGVPTEEDVFEAVIQWVKHDKEHRMQHLADLIHQVRYELLSSNYVLKHVAEDDMLKDVTGCKDFIIDALKYHLMSPSERASLSGRHISRIRIGGPQSIVVVGGQAPKAIKNIEIYDVQTHACKLGPELVSRRCRCGVTVLNGSVYAVGGFDGTSRVRSVERLDLEQGRWVPVEHMLSRRSTLGVGVLNGQLYAVGGFDGTNGLDTIERYSPETNQWANVASMSTRRSSVGVAIMNGYLFAVGGYDGTARQCLNLVERYDPSTDEWVAIEPMTQRRSGAAVAVIDGALYAIGGHDGPDIRKSVERLDPTMGKWRKVPDMAVPRRNAAAVVVHNLLYVVGGDDGIENLSSIEVFDPVNESWKEAEGRLTRGRSYAGVAVIDKPAELLPSAS